MKRIVFTVLLSLIGLSIISCKKDKEAPAPVADFTFDTTSVEPGIIKFTSTSQNAVAYHWSVKKNGTYINSSSEANPSFLLKNNGTYEFTLSVDNENSVSNTKTETIDIQNSSFVKAKGPNDPDLVWYSDKISNSKDTDGFYIDCENGVSRISIKLPTGYTEGKTYDVLSDKGFNISYQNLTTSYLAKNICKVKVSKATSNYIEGTFDFVAEDNSAAFSFTNGEFRVIF